QFHESRLFTHPLFQDPEFLEYQRATSLAAQGDRLPIAIQIQQLVPDIARELHTVREAVSGQLTFVCNSLAALADAQKAQGQNLAVLADTQKVQGQKLIAIERFADRM